MFYSLPKGERSGTTAAGINLFVSLQRESQFPT
jgi:hypothetical protein